MSDWQQPWMSDEWVEWWKSLDHSNCATYSLNEFYASYETCRDMHCPDCGKRTGGQGHMKCPERTPETQRVADERGSFAHWVTDAVNREAEACEDL